MANILWDVFRLPWAMLGVGADQLRTLWDTRAAEAHPYSWAPRPQGTDTGISDECQLCRLHECWARAFNDHDVEALIACFVPDGDWVTPAGRVLRGRQGIVEECMAVFPDNPDLRVLRRHESRYLLGQQAVIDNFAFRLTGFRSGVTLDGRSTVVLTRRRGGWWIVAFRDMVPLAPP